MMIVIASKANSIYLSECEALGEFLTKNCNNVQVQIILKHKTEWPAFLESLCTSYGFSKKTCPIVFTSEGELIGDATAFLAWAKQKFSKDFRITNEMKKKRA